jgi:hypothetical protein
MRGTEPIAERTLFAVDKDGHALELHLLIGKPYALDSQDWACPVALIGLHGVFPDMRGVDSWQALMQARNLLKNLLSYFVEDGGKLYWENGGEEMTVDELFSHRREDRIPDGPLTPQELQRVEELTSEELQKIDDAMMSHARQRWRKVALLVGSAMVDNRDTIKNVPDIFYAQRLRLLVEAGRLESQGDLNFMRFSEVKLPS